MSSINDFVRADSSNLPDIDISVILEHFTTSDKHNVAEIRGVKTLMASRNGYVQNAVGYVEIKRDNTRCTVRAKVVPEHKVTKKYYMVTVHLNEKDNTIIDTECDGCPASADMGIYVTMVTTNIAPTYMHFPENPEPYARAPIKRCKLQVNQAS